MEEDRSALFNQLKNFSQRKLKKVETKVVTGTGEQLVEKRGAKGLQVLTGAGDGAKAGGEAEQNRKLDLQVGFILPGLLIGSQDVAHDKSSLDSYGITHILSLDSGVENKFEDDYNYKNISVQDKPDFQLDKVLEDCFDFIDDGRHYGNVLVHCSGTIGLSRSTSICVAYLMKNESQKFDEAFNNVKEARAFVKPNEGFIKQLREYEVKLRGAQQVKESGIDDPFALRKKQEIEQEKAMVAGAASVKNRMKMFGATLDTNDSAPRSKSVSPSPYKDSSSAAVPKSPGTPAASKWSARNEDSSSNNNKSNISKSMTPEPRKSWQSSSQSDQLASNNRSSSKAPPPPPPLSSQPANNSSKPASSRTPTANSRQQSAPPPPPPPPPSSSDDASASKKPSSPKTVFGKVPPPPMKLRSGLSMEKQDPADGQSKASLRLPLKKQFTRDSDGGEAAGDNPRAPSPSAALRAAKKEAASSKSDQGSAGGPASGQQQQHRPSTCGQLNRSSTKKLLNLIKTKTRTDLTLPDGDENDEIEALLGALESESIENIDWDELGLDEDEVKGIIEKGANAELSSSSSSSSGDDDDEDSDEEEEIEEEEVETSTQHYIIRTK